MAAVADTCAVWNVLSSAILHRTCVRLSVEFALTGFVLYECLHKPRKERRDVDEQLQNRLRAARRYGEFKDHSLTVEDLQEVALLENRRRLSKGELSAIAFAKRVGLAFQTDDMGARKLGENLLEPDRVQTTPHLLGWLFFGGHLVDGDLPTIIEEHESFERPLRRYFEEAYSEAMRCRLLASHGESGAGSKR
jgi:hypothetical protein